MKHKIILIEDDKKIANIIIAYLNNADFEVEHYSKGREGLDAVIDTMPSLVILDLMLPDISGEEICQDIKNFSDIPIIMITAKISEEERLAGFSLGADDYITKPFSPRELVFRVKAILKRISKDSQEKLSFNNKLLELDSNNYEVKLDGKSLNFTATEFKIFYTLASRPDKVFPRDELLELSLGYDYDGYDRSIDVHIKNIRNKINKANKDVDFIKTVYGIGYKFTGEKD